MRELVSEWYVLLSAPSAAAAGPLRALGDAAGVPALTALILGLLGATAPCQLTTGAGALAFVARAAGDRRAALKDALAYVLGKALVYTVVGAVVVAAGREIVPVQGVVLVRRALGPLMLVLGLSLLGLLPFRFALGRGAAERLEARAGGGAAGALLLGVAFALAFCPTLFLLFFGFTIPLALTSPVGVLYPALFALGTSLPLLGLTAVLSAGVGSTRAFVARARRVDRWLRPVAGVVLVLAGLNDTVVYWFL